MNCIRRQLRRYQDYLKKINMDYLKELHKFLYKEVEIANSITIEDIKEQEEYNLKVDTESVEGKDLKGGTIEAELPPEMKVKKIMAKKVIDNRSIKELDFKLIYDKKRKCFIKKKKI